MSDEVTLTTEDRMAIGELYAAHAWRFDSGDAAGWAQLFLEDGRFVNAGREEYCGRPRLAEFVGSRHATGIVLGHHTTNIVVTAAPGGAHGRAYGLIVGHGGQAALSILNAGTYEDRLVRTPQGWRFAERVFQPIAPAAA